MILPVSQQHWSGQAKVGFIGLGQMGGPMAVNLIQKVSDCDQENLLKCGVCIPPIIIIRDFVH